MVARPVEGERVGQETALRLGAQVAEVNGLYAAVLAAQQVEVERRRLAELAHASALLAAMAGGVLGDRSVPHPRTRVVPRIPYGSQVHRRASNAGRVADRITAWAQRRS